MVGSHFSMFCLHCLGPRWVSHALSASFLCHLTHDIVQSSSALCITGFIPAGEAVYCMASLSHLIVTSHCKNVSIFAIRCIAELIVLHSLPLLVHFQDHASRWDCQCSIICWVIPHITNSQHQLIFFFLAILTGKNTFMSSFVNFGGSKFSSQIVAIASLCVSLARLHLSCHLFFICFWLLFHVGASCWGHAYLKEHKAVLNQNLIAAPDFSVHSAESGSEQCIINNALCEAQCPTQITSRNWQPRERRNNK